jgi:diacylglycerol kinase (ATP)
MMGRIKSLKYALNGMMEVFASQPNIRIEFIISLVVIILGFIMNISTTEWVIIILASSAVFVAEMFNTVIEYTLDFVLPYHHRTIGLIKDIAAGGVLLVCLSAIIIGIIIFVPKFYNLWLI